jgi:hypothetical protein
MQTLPTQNVYLHVNNDEADRVMIDPAYKLEKFAEMEEKVYAMHSAFKLVEQ